MGRSSVNTDFVDALMACGASPVELAGIRSEQMLRSFIDKHALGLK